MVNIWLKVRIYNEYVRIDQFKGNHSLGLLFYDLYNESQQKEHTKYTVYLFITILLFCLAYKFKIIKI